MSDAHEACGALLMCPVCGGRLSRTARALRCPEEHSHDLARAGYVDLLPAGHGRTGKTGDAPEMLRARRRFLEGGGYDVLRRALVARALEEAVAARTDRGTYVLLEAGCGEGFWIGAVTEATRAALAGSGVDVCAFGLDIARDAVRLAARRHRDVFFFTNDVKHRVCVADASVDLLLNVFAPRSGSEFARVMRDGGLLLVVIPTEHHLRELRSELPLLTIEPEKRERVVEQLRDGFALEGTSEVETQVELGGGRLGDVLRMTPNFRHLDDAAIAAAEAAPARPVTLGFQLLRLRRMDPYAA